MFRSALIVLICSLISSCSTYVTTHEVTTENHANGSLKRLTEVSIKKYDKFDLHTYYTKVTTHVTEYYDNGVKKLESEQVWKDGSYGKPCQEIKYWEKQYSELGVLRYDEKRSCDKHTVKFKTYDEAGELAYRKEVWSSYGGQVQRME